MDPRIKNLQVEIVAAISKNMVIGRDNKLPWNIKEDRVHFQELTHGHIVVMGKNTFLSLPHAPLPNRLNIVVSSTPEIFKDQDDIIHVQYPDLITLLESIHSDFPRRKIFIIGGRQMYKEFLPYATRLHLTHIDKVYEGDVYFPSFFDFSIAEFSSKFYSDVEKCSYQFIVYEKSNTQTVKNDMKYLKLLCTIMSSGKPRQDRTQTGTLSIFGKQLRFDISESVPLLTTKFVPWKSCIKELLWFLKGETDASILQKQGVHIWDGNTSREFLNSRQLYDLPEGDIGCGYGFQWRHFGAEYVDCKFSYESKGFDQIKYIIDQLKNDPFSRRIFMSSWNPLHMNRMALPPCHVSAQFYVEQKSDGKHLSCHVYQRSVDSFLGLPFNIFSYTVLTYILAVLCDMNPCELIISTGDTHIYNDHINQVETQISRTPISPPKLLVYPNIKTKRIEDITVDDFDLVGYFHHESLKGKMSV